MSVASLLVSVIAISKQAGAAILEIYGQSEMAVSHKEDDSPLTAADLAAHRVITTALQTLTPDVPVLSEESASISWDERRQWSRYWLVDPLDGTKEFIKRNGEFTVNIALIENGVPVLGVVYVPVLDWCYSGAAGKGARVEKAGETAAIHVAPLSRGQQRLRVVASRNHRGDELDAWLERVQRHYLQVDLLSMGSSLKICLVAEGKADVYPRLALTSEWDTAAAQAVLEAAGGILLDAQGVEYRYNRKDNILNPYFFALGDRNLGPALVTS
ncbi:MAG: 3'(2'),5'-bisphosphate nucleotidase CysQ [Pseudomonadota bacterium]